MNSLTTIAPLLAQAAETRFGASWIIIAILATLAIPRYRRAVAKARRAEAFQTIATLRSAHAASPAGSRHRESLIGASAASKTASAGRGTTSSSCQKVASMAEA